MGDYVRSPDGNLYLHNGLNRNDIFRISRDGKIYLFAGNGTKDRATDGRRRPGEGRRPRHRPGAGGRARTASLLIASYERRQLHPGHPRASARTARRSRRSRGNATARTAPLGDGKPALEAHIGQVNDMTVAPDGTIYWAERYSATQRLEGPPAQARAGRDRHDGRGRRRQGRPRTARPASEVALGSDPKGVAIGDDGSIYLALAYEKKVVAHRPVRPRHPLRGQGRHNERGGSSPAARRPSPTSTRRRRSPRAPTAPSTSARPATTSPRRRA